MLQTSLAIFITIAVAIGGGAASLWYALGALGGVGTVTVDGWTTFPLAGTPDADPYSKARSAREGSLPLGRAEGIAFIAERDRSGRALSRQCSYVVSGQIPAARFWTLHAADARLRPLDADGSGSSALSSYGTVRGDDGSVTLAISATASPGNWLQVTGTGELRLVLTLYDTPAAASESVGGIELPEVSRESCDG